MGDRHPPETSLDDAIDHVVREMLSVDPAPAFDRRMMQRIEQPSPPRVVWPRLAAASALVAMLIMLGMFLRTKTTSDLAPHDVSKVASGPAQSRNPVPTVAVDPRPTIPRSARASGQRRRNTERTVVAASVNEPLIPTIPSLDPPDWLAVKGLEQTAVSVHDLRISSLEVAELNVHPLRTLEERRQE